MSREPDANMANGSFRTSPNANLGRYIEASKKMDSILNWVAEDAELHAGLRRRERAGLRTVDPNGRDGPLGPPVPLPELERLEEAVLLTTVPNATITLQVRRDDGSAWEASVRSGTGAGSPDEVLSAASYLAYLLHPHSAHRKEKGTDHPGSWDASEMMSRLSMNGYVGNHFIQDDIPPPLVSRSCRPPPLLSLASIKQIITTPPSAPARQDDVTPPAKSGPSSPPSPQSSSKSETPCARGQALRRGSAGKPSASSSSRSFSQKMQGIDADFQYYMENIAKQRGGDTADAKISQGFSQEEAENLRRSLFAC